MKEPLDINYVTENDFTPRDCVQYYFPDYSYKLCDYILWERTCYPLSMITVLKQLYQMYLQSK